jgi:hypothetical protein
MRGRKQAHYHTDLLRYTLAARMVGHEARTDTIMRWSGLTEARVRELYRSYESDSGNRKAVRHRGPAPRQPAFFLRSAQMRTEAAALAAVCSILGVVPPRTLPNAHRELPNFRRGELLCRAYEMYRSLVGASELTLEHAALLVIAIAQATELRLGRCLHCGSAMVFDALGTSRLVCGHCCHEERLEAQAPLTAGLPAGPRPQGIQQSLL